MRIYWWKVLSEYGLRRSVKVRALKPRQNLYNNKSLNFRNHTCYNGENYQDNNAPIVCNTLSECLQS